MSHGDRVESLPDDFQILATTASAPYAAIGHTTKPIYGVQFHPEVTHSPTGKAIIQRFVVGVCQAKTDWTMVSDSIPIQCLEVSPGTESQNCYVTQANFH